MAVPIPVPPAAAVHDSSFVEPPPPPPPPSAPIHHYDTKHSAGPSMSVEGLPPLSPAVMAAANRSLMQKSFGGGGGTASDLMSQPTPSLVMPVPPVHSLRPAAPILVPSAGAAGAGGADSKASRVRSSTFAAPSNRDHAIAVPMSPPSGSIQSGASAGMGGLTLSANTRIDTIFFLPPFSERISHSERLDMLDMLQRCPYELVKELLLLTDDAARNLAFDPSFSMPFVARYGTERLRACVAGMQLTASDCN